MKQTSSRSPKRKISQSTAPDVAREPSAMVSFLLAHLPGATITHKFHQVSFLKDKKVFAFTQKNGVVLKLPNARIKQLETSRAASFLVMGSRVMKEWVLIEHSTPTEYQNDIELFKEAMNFVSGA